MPSLTIILLLLASVACQPVPPRPVAAPASSPTPVPTVVLGALLDSVDDVGPDGSQRFEAAKLAVELVNRRGGLRLPSGERRTLELSVYDVGRPDRAETAIRHLVDSGAVAAIGPADAVVVSAVRQAAETAHLPLVALQQSGDDTRAAQWTFALDAAPEEALTAMLDFFVASGVDKLGWLAPRTMDGTSARRSLLRLAASRSIQVVAEEAYPPGSDEYAPILTRIQAAGPRAILAWPRDSHEAASIAREVPKVRDLTPLFMGPGAASPSTLASAGEASVVVRTLTLRLPVSDDLWDHDPLTPVVRDFRRELQDRTGRPPTPEAAAAWDAVNLVVAAIERAGPTSSALRDALESTADYPGATGMVTFGPRRHDGLDRRAYVVARSEGRRWRLPP
ncbi:MAG: ABC transporter substrate-binding protein [Chloroflexota bacterium]